MAYFSNGTEFMIYCEEFCFQCQHFRERVEGAGDWGCPIMDLHFLWNSEALKDDDKQYALELFIPRERDENDLLTWNGECVMFLPEKG
jgi:hypothetical protein